MVANILILDDDPSILGILSDVLTEDGMTVASVTTASAFRQRIRSESFDLILLDIMLRDGSGYELCREIRDMVSCPVIFLSGKSTSDDIVKGLSIGADDYVTKPFVVEELVARIHAHLRRQRRNFAGKTQMALQMGEIELNPAARAVSRGGVPVTLSTHEFDLLEYLMRNAGRTVSREEILRDVWKTTYGDIGVVAINIRNLRAKIDPEWAYIKTMWGAGYRFAAPPAPEADKDPEASAL